ncbi:hypothetical protein C7271_12495 [filamentous cyanobacterium CCP5]|nr:hypothetical protein C7271_12495 [filamentous cyanobacterium CCP5]
MAEGESIVNGTVIGVRGSLVDLYFPKDLPPLPTMLLLGGGFWLSRALLATKQIATLRRPAYGHRSSLVRGEDPLFSALFQQHFFIGLYRACAESLASENVHRLASMGIAEKTIEERLLDLKVAFQQPRQDTMTEERLDIVSGFEALSHSP